MFTWTIILDVGNLFKYDHLSRIARLHELDKINLEMIPRRPYGQADGTARLSDTLSMEDVDKAQALFFYKTRSLPCVVNGYTPTVI
jgi:hypothetical protein